MKTATVATNINRNTLQIKGYKYLHQLNDYQIEIDDNIIIEPNYAINNITEEEF